MNIINDSHNILSLFNEIYIRRKKKKKRKLYQLHRPTCFANNRLWSQKEQGSTGILSSTNFVITARSPPFLSSNFVMWEGELNIITHVKHTSVPPLRGRRDVKGWRTFGLVLKRRRLIRVSKATIFPDKSTHVDFVTREIIWQFWLHHAGFIYTFQIEPGNVAVTQFSKHNITSAAATGFPRKSNSDSFRKTEVLSRVLTFFLNTWGFQFIEGNE